MEPWVLEFFEVSTGRVIGRAQFDGAMLLLDPAIRPMADAGMGPEGFLERYDGWSNGYVSARRPGEEGRRVITGAAVKLPPAAESDAAVQDLVETTHYWDEEAGSMYEPPVAPTDPSPDAEDNEDGA
jgi:hypothetical protein